MAMQEERSDTARFRLQLPTTVRQANGRGIKEIEQLIKQEALRRSNMEAERTQKRLGRTYRPRQVPRITKALGERLNRMRRVFRGEEPRRRRIGRAGTRR